MIPKTPVRDGRSEAGMTRSRTAEIATRMRGIGHPAAVVIVVAATLIVRRPEAVLRPQFMYEEPWAFYAVSRSVPPAEALVTPWGGLLQVPPRLVHTALLAVPGEIAPAIAILVLYALIGAVAAFMASDRMSDAIPSRATRVVFGLSLGVVPAAAGPLISVINAHWFLVLYLIGLSVATDSRRWRWIDRLGAGLIALSGPFSMFLWPLFARRRDLLVIVGAGGLVQAAYLLASTRRPPSFDGPAVASALLERTGTTILGSHAGTTVLLGGLTVVAVAVTAAAGVAIATSTLPRRTFMAFGYGTGAIAALGVTIAGGPAFADPGTGIRYFLPVTCFLTLVAIDGIIAGRLTVVPLAAAVAIGVVGDLAMFSTPDAHWPAAVACIQTTGPCRVDVYPDRWSFIWPDGIPPTVHR
jgi:hypothetical protein